MSCVDLHGHTLNPSYGKRNKMSRRARNFTHTSRFGLHWRKCSPQIETFGHIKNHPNSDSCAQKRQCVFSCLCVLWSSNDADPIHPTGSENPAIKTRTSALVRSEGSSNSTSGWFFFSKIGQPPPHPKKVGTTFQCSQIQPDHIHAKKKKKSDSRSWLGDITE